MTVVLLGDGMGLLTLQDIFCASYPDYERTHARPAHVRRAARAIMQCRTAALGGHVQACPDSHVARVWYNSCRHRSCPHCASLQTERWLALQQARLLACDHSHVLFTLPHECNPLWLAHVPVMTSLLLQAVRDTLWTLLADPTSLGAQPGIIAALPTWSQTLVLHPHVHGLVTGGGLTPAGQWVAVRHGFLLPTRVVLAVFRGKMVAALRQTVARGELALPKPMRPQQFLNLLNRLGHPPKTKWNVRSMERYRHGAGVVTSLARSLRGGPIKNARLVAWDGDRVTFLYRARHAEVEGGSPAPQRMTLAVADVLQRWLQHVPVPQTRVVRSYGLYHPTHAETLALCRAVLGQPPVVVPACLDWQTVCAQRGDAHTERCPTCGQLLVYTSVIPRGGAPPPVLAGEIAAGDRHAAGEGLSGGGVPGVCLVVAGGSLGGGWGTPQGRGTCSSVPQVRLLMGARGRMTAGLPGITSIACPSGTPWVGRIGGRSVQPGVEADTWPSGVGGEGVVRWRPGAA